jgi:aerobic-type carbon monoxide dehydrogenase small subunit (CoxS/CutS family)
MTKKIRMNINQKEVSLDGASNHLMINVLHETIGLTGTKICCGIGVCKACTFAYQDKENGPLKKAQACITPAAAMDGKHILTVEGLAQEGVLAPLQQAFLEHFSFQCGYSTPGFLMAGTVLLDELKRAPVSKDLVDQRIQEATGENICRCTGYVRYHRAIKEVVLNTQGLTI